MSTAKKSVKKKTVVKSDADQAKLLQEKQLRFKTVAARRANNVVKILKNIGNTSNKSIYSYTPEQVDKLFGAMEDAMKAAKAKFAERSKEAIAGIEL